MAKSYVASLKRLSFNQKINKYFKLYIKNNVTLNYYKEYAIKEYNIIWFLYPDYFNELHKNNSSLIFTNTIYGPAVSPINWFKFPKKKTYEEYWSDSINKLLVYVVQSQRVMNHLINGSERIKNIEKKYLISHGCIIPNTTHPLKNWNDRHYDIMIYAKFIDANKEKELTQLLILLSKKYTLLLIKYGNHTRESLLSDSNNCKIVIYFSYYDCWPSSLMEIESKGVYPIVHQCEFIGIYGKCIENIERNLSQLKAYIDILMNKSYNSKEIAEYYNDRNNCMSVMKETLSNIYYLKTKQKIDLC